MLKIEIQKIYRERIKISAKTIENLAKIEKSWQNHQQNSKDGEATLKNIIRIRKTLKNRKDTEATLQKPCTFRKLLYPGPGKLFEIVNFHEKSRNLHAKNSKDTPRTRQKSG